MTYSCNGIPYDNENELYTQRSTTHYCLDDIHKHAKKEKSRNALRDIENKLMVTKVGGEGIN